MLFFFFFSSRRRHTRWNCDWSSDVCSSDLNADGKDAREVTVVPLPSDFALRNRAWEEDNRRKVDELSGGKLAYVHVPDTAVGGWLNFNRFYFAQVGKQGAVIDERYNHGGEVADYIIDMLKR